MQVSPVNGSGQARGRVNGVAAAKAAAAATASAKALESHVNARNLPSAPDLATPPCSSAKLPTEGGKNLTDLISHDPIWAAVRAEARLEVCFQMSNAYVQSELHTWKPGAGKLVMMSLYSEILGQETLNWEKTLFGWWDYRQSENHCWVAFYMQVFWPTHALSGHWDLC